MLSRIIITTAPVAAMAGIVLLSACRDRDPADPARTVDSAKTYAPAPVPAPEDEVHSRYAGSASCKECHATAYTGWEKSNHGLAEREYREDMDKAAFSPKQSLQHGPDTSEAFLDAAGLAKILTRGLGDLRRAYPVTRIIGNDPLRQFLIPAPGGRLQTCDVSYDPHKNELFDVYGEEERNPGDWGAWTGQGMNWNAMCAACHNTRLRKNYEPSTNSYHTTMAEMSVGCEACHGPMKDHVDWQKSPPPESTRKDQENNKKPGIHDPTIKRQTRDQMLETCGACHSRRGELTGDLIPGESFYDHFSLTVTDDTDTYHPDGQVRDENYEFTSFLSSRMHHVGIRCADCHEPHSATRLIPGNMLCMRCHSGGTQPPAPVINPETHSPCAPNTTGRDCTSCHMPITTYMRRDPRHDHSFSSPDPLLTREYGIPNACNRCHTDKDTDWAVKTAEDFYGKRLKRPARDRAMLVARARRGEPSAREGLIRMLATEEIPAWKATACHLLARWVMDPEAAKALMEQTSHKSPLVREAALRSLTHQTRAGNERVCAAIQPMLDDASRSVRVAAAWALVDKLDLTSKAGRELTHMLDLNSDQPTGRMQLSQFAHLRGDSAAAIRQIRKAIEWDPNSPPFHHDLAILLSATGDNAGAIKALEKAIALAPEDPEYHYKLALALAEAGDMSKAVAALETTVKLDSGNGRAWYNLGLAYNGVNQPQSAIAALKQGETAEPSDSAIPYARATIHARLGQRNEALQAATRALQLRRDFPEAIQLIQSISR
ncbi:MAG: tetratricopeptide repeat protein [Luteolibacter sp.]|jgi:tetratricopeptide (TPR) repeat protein|nr:tetratricopeptide repeat protein [Luteolibacter sp.]